MFAISRLATAAMLCACAAIPVAAQQLSTPVETKLVASKIVIAADGKETLAAADKAGPGDVIEYKVTYRNTGAKPVKNLVATLPIPDKTEFLPGSAQPANARASLDAAAFADMPLKRTVVRNGVSAEEAVPFREYRYLRWFPGELGGDKSVTFIARVKVLDDTPPAVPGKGGGK